MDLHLGGKIAIVTGASKGIGLAVTRALVEEGPRWLPEPARPAPTFPHSRPRATLSSCSSTLRRRPEPSSSSLVPPTSGGVDILINSAGAVTRRPRGFTSVTDEEWDHSIALTLIATIRTTRTALPQMTRRGGGSIVTISSVNAYLPDPLLIDYSAAKAARTNFCKSLSKELGPSGIRVNTISPGPVATALWLGDHGMAQTVAQSAGVKPGDVAAQAAAGVAGRFTRPEEVADLALLLASDRTGNVTGSDFSIDGGLVQTL